MPTEPAPRRRRTRIGSVVSDTRCPIPGCRDYKLVRNLVCLNHSVEIWGHVQSLKGEPLVQEAILESVAERERRLEELEKRRAEARKQLGWIYYLKLDDRIKIGWTSNLGQRLQSYPPYAQSLTEHPGTRADERDLHRTFKPSRSSGREWYFPTPELMAHIDRVRAAEMERRTQEHLAQVNKDRTSSGMDPLTLEEFLSRNRRYPAPLMAP